MLTGHPHPRQPHQPPENAKTVRWHTEYPALFGFTGFSLSRICGDRLLGARASRCHHHQTAESKERVHRPAQRKTTVRGLQIPDLPCGPPRTMWSERQPRWRGTATARPATRTGRSHSPRGSRASPGRCTERHNVNGANGQRTTSRRRKPRRGQPDYQRKP